MSDTGNASRKPQERTVERLFDNAFYIIQEPNRSVYSKEENLTHYLQEGWKMGLQPAAWFDVGYYLNRSPDVSEASVEPFGHYLKYGILEGRAPGPEQSLDEESAKLLQSIQPYDANYLNKIEEWFDDEHYIEQLPVCRLNHCDPKMHYLSFGWKMGLNPNKWFDGAFYLEQFEDAEDYPHSPFTHFLEIGRFQGRAANSQYFDSSPVVPVTYSEQANSIRPHFDEQYYIEQMSEKDRLGYDPLAHYCAIGWRLGLCPNRWFDPKFYVGINSDVRESVIEPLYHFIRWGVLEGRRPNPNDEYPSYILGVDQEVRSCIAGKFDPLHYAIQKDVPQNSDIKLIDHYISFGEELGLSPSPDFDPRKYVERYYWGNRPAKGAFYNYLQHGKQMGYVASSPRIVLKPLNRNELRELYSEHIDIGDYQNRHEDLAKFEGDLLDHFIIYGEQEGRRPFANFDPEQYRSQFMHSADSDGRPLEHYLRYGLRNGFESGPNANLNYDPSARVNKTNTLQSFFRAQSKHDDINTSRTLLAQKKLDIHFVIPDFTKGSGGHMTIFRIIKWLEFFGHKLSIWILNPSFHGSPEEARDTIIKSFQPIKSNINFVSDALSEQGGDILFATAWQTSATVRLADNFGRKFYLIQDHETEFYPTGTDSMLSKLSYQWGFDCICASPWLAQLMSNYGSWARPFWLAYDQNTYSPPLSKRENGVPRLAVYARHFTARRAVELVVLALQELALEGLQFHVDFFGADYDVSTCPFSATSHGVLSEIELAELYKMCDIGVCFSATNYSLVPKEMMGTGLPVVELNSPCSQAIYPEDAVLKVGPDPVEIVNGLRNILTNAEIRKQISSSGQSWASQFTWGQSAKMIEDAIYERIGEQKGEEKPTTILAANTFTDPRNKKATVIIPTYNGGDLLLEVCNRVQSQLSPWPFDVLIIDSSSTDGTFETLKERFPEFRFIQIPQSEFSHGRTRNSAISETDTEFVCFLTQDALPNDDYWLYNLVTTTEAYPSAAGSFGQHIAHDNAEAFTKRDLALFFREFNEGPVRFHRGMNKTLWNLQDRPYIQRLHYFSDNNSCLRRSVWEQIPYPDVEYGEDQAWALEIIRSGFEKIYARSAIVKHSHDYDLQETFDRAKTEADFFKNYFGYALLSDSETLQTSLKNRNHQDRLWAEENNLSESALAYRVKQNEAHLRGWLAGTLGEPKTDGKF